MLLVKNNFKENYRKNGIIDEKSLVCPVCKKHSDTQQNLVNCEMIKNSESIIYENIFDDKNIDEQMKALKGYMKMWEKRQIILEKEKNSTILED